MTTPITEEMKPEIIAALRDQRIATLAASRTALNKVDSIEGLVAMYPRFQWPHTPQPANDVPEFQRVEPIVSKFKATYFNGDFLITPIFGPLSARSSITIIRRLTGTGAIEIRFDSPICQAHETLTLERQEAIELANALMSAAQDMKE